MSLCYVDKLLNIAPKSMFVPHMHLWFEMHFLIKGTRTVQIENESYSLTDNCVICIPPELFHKTEGSEYSRINLNFSKDYLDEFQLNIITICQMQKISMSPEESKHIFKILSTLEEIQNNITESFKETKSYAFKTCFSYLIFSLTQLKDFPSTQYVSPNNYNLRTRQIISYLQEHYPEKITLEDLSKIFKVSIRCLSAEFKKYTDSTITDFLLKIRLEQAKKLLSFANKRKINHIAELCGFSSQTYFYLIFKKKMNISPSEYRNQVVNRFSKKTPPPPTQINDWQNYLFNLLCV